MSGYMVTQSLAVAARLEIADHLASGPVAAEDLAERTKANPDALYRVLRALASVGVFEETPGRRFGQTPLSELLRADHKPSLRHLAMLFGGDLYSAWEAAHHSVLTGEPAFPKVFGAPHFEDLGEHPEALELFTKAMGGAARGRLEGLLEIDWSTAKKVVDIGGGDGTLLVGLLQRHPALEGVVFDLPEVIGDARANVEQGALADRCTCVAGSFLDDVPAGADVYVLARVLHNWSDEQASKILRRCRAAVKPGGRVVIIDDIIGEGNGPQIGKFLDLQMLVILGGRERTAAQWATLLGDAGFRMTTTKVDPRFGGLVEGVAI
jgi:predicted O-methyltransferase YrrM